jgi:hypothetical protein
VGVGAISAAAGYIDLLLQHSAASFEILAALPSKIQAPRGGKVLFAPEARAETQPWLRIALRIVSAVC